MGYATKPAPAFPYLGSRGGLSISGRISSLVQELLHQSSDDLVVDGVGSLLQCKLPQNLCKLPQNLHLLLNFNLNCSFISPSESEPEVFKMGPLPFRHMDNFYFYHFCAIFLPLWCQRVNRNSVSYPPFPARAKSVSITVSLLPPLRPPFTIVLVNAALHCIAFIQSAPGRGKERLAKLETGSETPPPSLPPSLPFL